MGVIPLAAASSNSCAVVSIPSRRLGKCHSISDLRWLAQRQLPSPIFNYLDGGAEEEITLRRNTAAFDDEMIIPRCLVDVTSVATKVNVLGQDLDWPVICSPAGSQRFYHADGELAAARAAARAGTLYSLAAMSSNTLEDVAAASAGPKMFQIFIFKDRDVTRDLIARCKKSGFKALCLTVDVSVRGKRERELRSGMGIPMNFSAASLASFALRPQWLYGLARKGPFSMPTFAGHAGSTHIVAQTRYFGSQLDASLTWKDVREFVELWGGPFAIKGLLSATDAQLARDVGASAVMVSNHGGRQLDGAVAPFDALPSIVKAVGNEIEVILDGGVRRGVHVLKALAHGAKACSVGRPYLFGLGAGGEAGVYQALQILKTELIRSMQLSGCTDVRNIDPQIVRRYGGPQAAMRREPSPPPGD
jgi:L-lactate dehydrogenase (cytochrome)